MNTTIPKSNATNAWDLFEDIIKVVQEEPRRLDMREFMLVPGTAHKYDWAADLEFPPCGTIGCVAGWINLLVKGNYSVESGDYSDFDARDILMGLQDNPIYDPTIRKDLDALFFKEYPLAQPGTKEYVDHVVTRIRQFMTKHETYLRNRRIPHT